MNESNPARCRDLRQIEHGIRQSQQENRSKRQRVRQEIERLRREIGPVFSRVQELRAAERAAGIAANSASARARTPQGAIIGGALGLTQADIAVRLSVNEARLQSLQNQMRTAEMESSRLDNEQWLLEANLKRGAGEMASLNCVRP